MIRLAVPDDGPQIMKMGEGFFNEAGHGARFTFDRESFAHSVIQFAKNDLLLVVEKDGQVVGMAAADVAPAFWNYNVLLAREAWWYLLPAHRQGIGRRLLVALEDLLRARGATLFDVVAEDGEGSRSEALARLYRAGGFSPAERTFRKVLTQGAEPCRSDQSLVA